MYRILVLMVVSTFPFLSGKDESQARQRPEPATMETVFETCDPEQVEYLDAMLEVAQQPQEGDFFDFAVLDIGVMVAGMQTEGGFTLTVFSPTDEGVYEELFTVDHEERQLSIETPDAEWGSGSISLKPVNALETTTAMGSMAASGAVDCAFTNNGNMFCCGYSNDSTHAMGTIGAIDPKPGPSPDRSNSSNCIICICKANNGSWSVCVDTCNNSF